MLPLPDLNQVVLRFLSESFPAAREMSSRRVPTADPSLYEDSSGSGNMDFSREIETKLVQKLEMWISVSDASNAGRRPDMFLFVRRLKCA